MNNEQNSNSKTDKFSQAKESFLEAIAKKVYVNHFDIKEYEEKGYIPNIPEQDRKVLFGKLAELHYQGYLDAQKEISTQGEATMQNDFSRPNIEKMLNNMLEMYSYINNSDSALLIAKEITSNNEYIDGGKFESFCQILLKSGREGKEILTGYLSSLLEKSIGKNNSYIGNIIPGIPQKLDEILGEGYVRINFIDKYLVSLSNESDEKSENGSLINLYHVANVIGYTQQNSFWERFEEIAFSRKDMVSLQYALEHYENNNNKDDGKSKKKVSSKYLDSLKTFRGEFVNNGDHDNAAAVIWLQESKSRYNDELFTAKELETLASAMIDNYKKSGNIVTTSNFGFVDNRIYNVSKYLEKVNTPSAWLKLANLYGEAMNNSDKRSFESGIINAYLKAEKPELALEEIKKHDNPMSIKIWVEKAEEYQKGYPDFYKACLELRAMKTEELMANGKESEVMRMYGESEPKYQLYKKEKEAIRESEIMNELAKATGLVGENWPLIQGYIKAHELTKWIGKQYYIKTE